tara:strand:+ start:78 stop:1094 length:1017 start_codon:yes stop_codon:yes gene_type:complete
MRILITGGCGFIGSNLAIYLKTIGHKVQTLDNLSRNGAKFNLKELRVNEIKNHKLDIRNYSSLVKLKNFDLIIDCCAEPSVESSKKNLDLTFYTNLVGTYNLLKIASINKSKIIFLSTSRVYSIKEIQKKTKFKNFKIIKKFKINEKFSTSAPISLYGYSKLSSEMLIKEFSFLKKIDFIINRFGLVAGPGQFGKIDQGVVSYWIWRRINSLSLSYKGYGGSGNQIRDILHIKDLIFIIGQQVRNIKTIKNEIFNIGGGISNSISLFELNNSVSRLLNKRNRVLRIIKTSQYDIPMYISDNSKIKKFYKWKPKFSLKNIITDIYNWQIAKKDKIKLFF